jgi:uncharacterized phosphosugar-binding protein
MSPLADAYYDRSTQLLARARAANAATLARLGAVIGGSLAAGGVLHAFGSGHSEVIAREIVGRAGGLVCVNVLTDPTGGFVENLVGYGTSLVERYERRCGLRPGETFLVISNSGKNSSPLEVALHAKARGLHVVALTSVTMAQQVATVHPSGRRLHEIADFTLDNGGPMGDALIDTGDGEMGGPTSTVVGAMLLNLLSLEIIAWLRAHGHTPPILRSQNLPGAIEHNRALAQRYAGRLNRLLA